MIPDSRLMGVAHAAVGVRKGLTDGTAGATALPNAPSVAAYPLGHLLPNVSPAAR